jgi:hypothetical protein
MNVDRNIFQLHNNIEEVRISQKYIFSITIYLGTSCNKIDDDNLSIGGPHFEEFPSGAG